MNTKPHIQPKVITPDECQRLVSIIRQAQHAQRNDDLRTEIPARAHTGEERQFLKQVLDRSTQAAIQGLKIRIPIYPEFTLLQANKPGDGHVRHADNVKWDGKAWVPNHTPQRIVSAGLYLSDPFTDFKGGELIFPTHHLRLRVQPGTLVAFHSHVEHEVRKVRAGIRYSVIFWWTGDPSREEKWD